MTKTTLAIASDLHNRSPRRMAVWAKGKAKGFLVSAAPDWYLLHAQNDIPNGTSLRRLLAGRACLVYLGITKIS